MKIKRVVSLTLTWIIALGCGSHAETAGMSITEMACAAVDYPGILGSNTDKNNIMESLELPFSSESGAKLAWTSNKPEYITESGRVIRPFSDENDEDVELTLTASYGDAHTDKTFCFKVKKEESFSDPMHMKDSEFFGVFSNGKWTVSPKLDYTLDNMDSVESAVKIGDYTTAKKNLLEYFRNKNRTEQFNVKDRSYADMTADFHFQIQQNSYMGEFESGKDFKEKTIELSADKLTPGSYSSLSVRAWYNEASSLEIYGCNAGDENLRPALVLTVNGEEKVFRAVDTDCVRGGKYITEPQPASEIIKAKTFGEFNGEDTYYAYIKFNLTSLPVDADISSAKLKLNARAVGVNETCKRAMVLFEHVNTWDSETAWIGFSNNIYSYNGLANPDFIHKPAGSSSEFFWQMMRFDPLPHMAVEYKQTGDEKYAHGAIRFISEYVKSCGSLPPYNTAEGLRGLFPRSLDAAAKNTNISSTFYTFIKSKYATPDYCAAVLKNIWDTAHALSLDTHTEGNWRQHQFNSLLETVSYFPELADTRSGENWMRKSIDELSDMIVYRNNLPDGSYAEDTCGYANSAFEQFYSFRHNLSRDGYEVPERLDEALRKNAYYNAMLFTSDGTTIQYGDGGGRTFRRKASLYEAVADLTGDDFLKYIVTFGEKGKKPPFTSCLFPDSTVSQMRNDWSKTSPYLFTNVRGLGGHGHADDNAIIFYAYDRILLNDSGTLTYTNNKYRQYAISTEAHNTVMVNDKSQNMDGTAGDVHTWIPAEEFDYICQSTYQNDDADHKRSIIYIKPDIFIVTDKMTPKNGAKSNNYKQIWHMYPWSNMTVQDRRIYSNYEDGANIIVASADADLSKSAKKAAWYDMDGITDCDYGFFEKTGADGNQTFSTVLFPYKENTEADVRTEVIESSGGRGVRTEIECDGTKRIVFSFNSDGGGNGTFGNYETDAEMAYILTDSDGNCAQAAFVNGSYVKQDGQTVIKTREKSESYSVKYENDKITVITDADIKTVGAVRPDENRELYVNGKRCAYTVFNGVIEHILYDEPIVYECGETFDAPERFDGFVKAVTAADPSSSTYGRFSSAYISGGKSARYNGDEAVFDVDFADGINENKQGNYAIEFKTHAGFSTNEKETVSYVDYRDVNGKMPFNSEKSSVYEQYTEGSVLLSFKILSRDNNSDKRVSVQGTLLKPDRDENGIITNITGLGWKGIGNRFFELAADGTIRCFDGALTGKRYENGKWYNVDIVIPLNDLKEDCRNIKFYLNGENIYTAKPAVIREGGEFVSQIMGISFIDINKTVNSMSTESAWCIDDFSMRYINESDADSAGFKYAESKYLKLSTAAKPRLLIRESDGGISVTKLSGNYAEDNIFAYRLDSGAGQRLMYWDMGSLSPVMKPYKIKK